MDREIVDILSFGACLGALVRQFFGLKVDLHWCVGGGAAAIYILHRGFAVADLLGALPPHALELAAAVYFASLLVRSYRETPARRGDRRYNPRRYA